MTQAADQPVILKSHLRKPQLPNDLVARQRWLDQLNLADQYPVTLVCEPAGYGKTTLVSTWLEQSPHYFIWLNLGEELNDLYLFLRYLSVAHDLFLGTFANFILLFNGSTIRRKNIFWQSLVMSYLKYITQQSAFYNFQICIDQRWS